MFLALFTTYSSRLSLNSCSTTAFHWSSVQRCPYCAVLCTFAIIFFRRCWVSPPCWPSTRRRGGAEVGCNLHGLYYVWCTASVTSSLFIPFSKSCLGCVAFFFYFPWLGVASAWKNHHGDSYQPDDVTLPMIAVLTMRQRYYHIDSYENIVHVNHKYKVLPFISVF